MDRKKFNIVDYYYNEIVGHMTKDCVALLVSHLVRYLVFTKFTTNLNRMGKCVKIVDICEKIQEK